MPSVAAVCIAYNDYRANPNLPDNRALKEHYKTRTLETLEAYNNLGVDYLLKAGDGMGVFLKQYYEGGEYKNDRPKQEIALAMDAYIDGFFEAVKEFYEDKPNATLQKVNFFTVDDDLTAIFKQKLNEFKSSNQGLGDKIEYCEANDVKKSTTFMIEEVHKKESSEGRSITKLGMTIAPNGNQEFIGGLLQQGNVLEELIAAHSDITLIGNFRSNLNVTAKVDLESLNLGGSKTKSMVFEHDGLGGLFKRRDLNSEQREYFNTAIDSQTNNPRPVGPYRGIGARVMKVENGYQIEEIFSPESGRFQQHHNSGGGAFSVIKKDLQQGDIITQVKVGDNMVSLNDMTEEQIASAFHAKGTVEFMVRGADGKIRKYSCDNDRQDAIFAPTPKQQNSEPQSFKTLNSRLNEEPITKRQILIGMSITKLQEVCKRMSADSPEDLTKHIVNQGFDWYLYNAFPSDGNQQFQGLNDAAGKQQTAKEIFNNKEYVGLWSEIIAKYFLQLESKISRNDDSFDSVRCAKILQSMQMFEKFCEDPALINSVQKKLNSPLFYFKASYNEATKNPEDRAKIFNIFPEEQRDSVHLRNLANINKERKECDNNFVKNHSNLEEYFNFFTKVTPSKDPSSAAASTAATPRLDQTRQG